MVTELSNFTHALCVWSVTCVHMPVCEHVEARVSHQLSWSMVAHPLFEAGSHTELKLSAGLQCTAPHPASTHVLESDLGSSCLYTIILLLYLCFTLKCYFYCAGVCMICVRWRSEDDFGSSLLSEASVGGAQVSRIQQQLDSLSHLPYFFKLSLFILFILLLCVYAHTCMHECTCVSSEDNLQEFSFPTTADSMEPRAKALHLPRHLGGTSVFVFLRQL